MEQEYIALTINGLEDISINEIKEILKVPVKKVVLERILFKTKDIQKLISKTHSLNTVYQLINYFKFKNKNEILNKVKDINFDFIKKDFLVRCKRVGEHKFDSMEIEKSIGEIIFHQDHKVNMENPEILIYIDIIDNLCFIGVLIKKDLCKRDYRVRICSASINACIAYSLLKIAESKKEDVILDPFCKDGIIPIEAYLSGYKKIKASDETFFNVKSSKINAKIAKAKINFSQYGVDWLDTKIKGKSIDKIITSIPSESKSKSVEETEKLYKELFNQSNYVLKKRGTITILTKKPNLLIKIAKENKYKLIKKRKIIKGETYYILIFKK